MTKHPTSDHYRVFAQRVVATLPDSFNERRIVLVCLLSSLPKGHEMAATVAKLLHHLEAHERLQLDLSLNFTKGGVQ